MPKVVLVVDDDAHIRDAICSILEDEGYQAICVEHGRAALDYLKGGAPRPCMILLDLMMPVMDGWQFRAHQKASKEYADIPVVVISAAGPDRSSSIDAERVLQKPLTFDTIVNTVSEIC